MQRGARDVSRLPTCRRVASRFTVSTRVRERRLPLRKWPPRAAKVGMTGKQRKPSARLLSVKGEIWNFYLNQMPFLNFESRTLCQWKRFSLLFIRSASSFSFTADTKRLRQAVALHFATPPPRGLRWQTVKFDYAPAIWCVSMKCQANCLSVM